MSRVQLALNVGDLDEAVDFYRKLFGAEPHKRRPGYANFALDEPPLKLVLMAGEGVPGSVNHLGVEVDSGEEVREAADRLALEQLEIRMSEGEVCCYATQDKVWVTGPDSSRWEVYTVTDDAPDERAAADAGVQGSAGQACC